MAGTLNAVSADKDLDLEFWKQKCLGFEQKLNAALANQHNQPAISFTVDNTPQLEDSSGPPQDAAPTLLSLKEELQKLQDDLRDFTTKREQQYLAISKKSKNWIVNTHVRVVYYFTGTRSFLKI